MNKESIIEDARHVGYALAGQYVACGYFDGLWNFDFDSISFLHKIIDVINNLEVPFNDDLIDTEMWREMIDVEIRNLCTKELF